MAVKSLHFEFIRSGFLQVDTQKYDRKYLSASPIMLSISTKIQHVINEFTVTRPDIIPSRHFINGRVSIQITSNFQHEVFTDPCPNKQHEIKGCLITTD